MATIRFLFTEGNADVDMSDASPMMTRFVTRLAPGSNDDMLPSDHQQHPSNDVPSNGLPPSEHSSSGFSELMAGTELHMPMSEGEEESPQDADAQKKIEGAFVLLKLSSLQV